MSEFMAFDDMSDAFRWMEEQTNAANAALAPEQRALTWGSTWVRFYAPYRIVIFGRVHEMDEVLAAERDLGAPPGEVEWMRNRMIANHERGYLMGTAWSTIEPRGEDGDTHRANAWPCTAQLINEGREVGWVQSDLPERGIAELAAIFKAWSQHLAQ